MLWRPQRSSNWLVSVCRNSEPDRKASSKIECEMVVSSSSRSPLEFRPAARRSLPSRFRRKTYPRSERHRGHIQEREWGSHPERRWYSACARLPGKMVSFSRSVASFEIWIRKSGSENPRRVGGDAGDERRRKWCRGRQLGIVAQAGGVHLLAIDERAMLASWSWTKTCHFRKDEGRSRETRDRRWRWVSPSCGR